jgi:hypothetical protein
MAKVSDINSQNNPCLKKIGERSLQRLSNISDQLISLIFQIDYCEGTSRWIPVQLNSQIQGQRYKNRFNIM